MALLQYATAKELRKAAAAAKRSSEVATRTATDSNYLGRDHPLYLSPAQIATLNEAAKVLTLHHKAVAKLARQKAKEERQFETARVALVPGAEAHLADWPLTAIADKVAFCIVVFGEFSGLQRETKIGLLDMWVESARPVLTNTATVRAVHTGKSISEVMDKSKAEFDVLRRGSGIAPLVLRWEDVAKQQKGF